MADFTVTLDPNFVMEPYPYHSCTIGILCTLQLEAYGLEGIRFRDSGMAWIYSGECGSLNPKASPRPATYCIATVLKAGFALGLWSLAACFFSSVAGLSGVLRPGPMDCG